MRKKNIPLWIIFVVGVLVFLLGVVNLVGSLQPTFWETTDGCIVDSHLESYDEGDTVLFVPRVFYTYSLDNMEYTHTTISLLRKHYSRKSAEALLEKFPMDCRVEVRYHPENPRRAVLLNEYSRTGLSQMIFGILLGFLVLLYIRHPFFPVHKTVVSSDVAPDTTNTKLKTEPVANHTDNKHTITTEAAPAAIGPYAQGKIEGHFIYTSGQIPIDVKTGVLLEGIEKQTEQVILNTQAVLEEAGSSLDKVVKTTIYLTDMALFDQMNEIYSCYFAHTLPARSTVEVSGLPKGALIEMETVAHR